MPTATHQSRRDAIRSLLARAPAENQGALVAALRADGIEATQSSVSRDLRELGAIKTARGYELPDGGGEGDAQVEAVAGLLRGTQAAGPNLLVIRTAIGAAQRVALAFDRVRWPGMVGTIAGDDTIFVATESGNAQRHLLAKLEHLSGT